MRKSVLFLSLILSPLAGVAQNVQDQKVAFQYTQMPLQPLDKNISTYKISLNTASFEQMNADSMDLYNAKLMTWQAQYDNWLLQKKNIDKAYLKQMASYEKAVNAGNVNTPVPQKTAYPPMPVKDNIPMPILTEEVTMSEVENTVKLEGYSRGDNGVEIELELLGFQNAGIEVKTKKSETKIDYTYSSVAKYPVRVKVIHPSKGIIFDQLVGNSTSTRKIKTYTSKYDYDYWAIDSLEGFWKRRQKEMLQTNLNQVYNLINDNFGFQAKTYQTEIYTVKKHKNHSYNDLVDAYSYANSGYALVINDKQHTQAMAQIKKAIAIWEKALTESNINDNKSRINKKVTALLYCNLAEAYMWINDFVKAENYRLKAEQGGVLKFKSHAKKMAFMNANLKKRYLANF